MPGRIINMGMKKSSKNHSAGKAYCFICGGKSFEKGFGGIKAVGGVYSVYFCASCGLGRTDPFLDPERLRKIYSSTYREDDSTRFAAPIERLIRYLRGRRRGLIEKFSAKGSILDIGCGRGDFLGLMAEKGWQVSGLDLDDRIAGHGRRTGMDLRSGTIEDAGFPDERFNTITFWHVFEHLREPLRTLAECRRVLKDDGLLVVAIPDVASTQARLTGKEWFHLDPPYHLYHYSHENIKTLLSKAGFEVVHIGHFSLEYGPYGFLQSIFNRLGLGHNLFYDFLRSKWERSPLSYMRLLLSFMLLPIALPISVFLSVFEAAAGRGGAIEVYARKKEDR